ncbi:PREDICTED: uncharacterized protein LOC109174892 isoform X2 [Ipomoea nil]|uniref:uncharacterized protein LOC109174892 isoform X2 n=1 Tax=Ipomoea nil TaxID=35883 RepID=UPI00090169D1|nr:PREDICTED: uncharacterized protein LOC109174892 isoform X2 [Ipomoea nil]
MASMKFSSVLVLLLACILSFEGVLADIICENLPINACAFSVSSNGKRCVLENSIKDNGKVEYECKTSDVVVGSSIAEYSETDECVKACGVGRKSVGMSSDGLLDPTFTAKLCSPECYNNCPNIVDLYFNLAAGEGAYLPDLCEKKQKEVSPARRDMIQLESDGDVDSAAASPADAEWTSPRRNMIQLQSDSAAASPVADAPTQWKNNRRAIIELLSSGGDDFDVDTPAPSPSYF